MVLRENKSDLRKLILASAREIFVQQGYESFSMRKLANVIGCSPGTIYLHFENKADLFQSLVEESFARLYQALLGLRDRHHGHDPVVLLKKGLYTYIEFGLRNPNDYRFAFLIPPPVDDQPYKVHPAFDVMRLMVDRCVRERRFRPDVDVETTSQALWAVIHGITSLLIQRPTFPWVGRAKLIAQVVNSALDSLLAKTVVEKGGISHAQLSSP